MVEIIPTDRILRNIAKARRLEEWTPTHTMDNWIAIEVFGFSAKANGTFAIVALTIVALAFLTLRSRSKDIG